MEEKKSFTEAEAARYLALSRSTLRQGRMDGARKSRCPTAPYIRLGRAIRYLKADLDQWLENHRVSDGIKIENTNTNDNSKRAGAKHERV